VTRAIVRPERESYVLVQFAYGDGAATLASYTDLERDVTPYVSTPLLEVDIPDNVGTFQEKECRIVLPLDAFTDRLSDGLPHSPVYVRVEQQIRGLTAGESGTNLVLFRGRVERTFRNHQRRSNMVAVQALLAKSRLDVHLGLQMNHHDEARIFGPMSGVAQVTHQRTGQIAVIDGKEVTISTPNASITSPTAPGGTNDRFWERGWLEKDGARIGVHIWTIADPTVFVLRERPPGDWLLAGAASILFVPGTHGTIEDARAVWDDEEHFLGYGYASLNYNPIIQNPFGASGRRE
jgi:hypothetical protein